MTSPAARVPLFLNEAAGPVRGRAAEIADVIAAVDVRAVPPDQLPERVAAEVRRGTPVVAIAGGDGTLHSAAPLLVGRPTALLCVPTGTLNSFARRVGITTIADAAAALRRFRVESLPVGVMQDSYFLNTLTLGEYARVVRMRERYRRFLGKWPAALLAFGVAVATVRHIAIALRIEDEVRTRRTPFVWIGIGWGSFPVVHESLERRETPELEVAVVRSQTKRAGLGFMLRLAAGMVRGRTPVRDAALEVLHTRELTIDSQYRIDATADGEVLRLAPPVSVGIRHAALRVLVGPGFRQ